MLALFQLNQDVVCLLDFAIFYNIYDAQKQAGNFKDGQTKLMDHLPDSLVRF